MPAVPQLTESPYWVDEKLFRSDIRTDPDTGVARPGVTLALSISLQNLSSGGCVPLTGALVDIWHCDAMGIYSDEPAYNPGGGTGTVVTRGQRFLRGYQVSDDSGQASCTIIYPGWYSGRTIHIHVRVRTYAGATKLDDFVTQVFFDDAASNTILKQSAYTRSAARDTTNTNDNVYAGAANANRMLATLTQNGTGYAAAITLGASLKTAAVTAPAITAGGTVNAGSGAAGFSQGSWIALYGTNLAASARTLAASDVVNGQLPVTLGGVSVQISGKAAFLLYVSPTQINALAPADCDGFRARDGEQRERHFHRCFGSAAGDCAGLVCAFRLRAGGEGFGWRDHQWNGQCGRRSGGGIGKGRRCAGIVRHGLRSGQ